MKEEEKPYSGKYLIWIEWNDDGSVDFYSTDSIFWRDFYGGTPEKLLFIKDNGEKIYGR